jgi:hypothetical protein
VTLSPPLDSAFSKNSFTLSLIISEARKVFCLPNAFIFRRVGKGKR